MSRPDQADLHQADLHQADPGPDDAGPDDPVPDAASLRSQEIAAEQRFVNRAYERLAEVRANVAAVHAEGMARGRYRHRAGLVERDAMVFHAARRLRAIDGEYEGLVFARLDYADGTTRYIGRLGIRDADLTTMLVDWRAPAAAPFYQATAAAPMGLTRRRVIRCAGSTVQDIDDELLAPDVPGTMRVVGEGALMAALTRARGTTMRDIVPTIQREQDEAIRAPARGVVEITGGPGTGKTAVALHRAAFLLYRDRDRYGPAGVLIVGPSETFISYISHVLPSLGEDQLDLCTFGDLLHGVRATRREPARVEALKGALRMCEVMRRLAHEPPPGAPAQLRITYAGEVLRLGPEDLARVRQAVLATGVAPNTTRMPAAEALIDALYGRALRYADERFRPTRAAMYADLLDRDDFLRFLYAWWPFAAPTTRLAWLADRQLAARVGAGVLTPEEVDLLAESYARTPADPTSPHADDRWSVADVALLDELRHVAGEPPARTVAAATDPDQVPELRTWAERTAREVPPRPPNYDGYGLVIVDEAQDVTPMQWRMLGRRGRYADWTIVGDPAQRSWPDPDEASHARAEALRARRPHRRFHLGINYRNSTEIFALAASVLVDQGPDALPRAVRATGIQPRIMTVTPDDLPAAVVSSARQVRAEVAGTVGVICPTNRTLAFRELLADACPDARVLSSWEAKGLEFDAVVVVEPAEIIAESDGGRRQLYVALSRATHRQHVVGTDPSWRAVPEG